MKYVAIPRQIYVSLRSGPVYSSPECRDMVACRAHLTVSIRKNISWWGLVVACLKPYPLVCVVSMTTHFYLTKLKQEHTHI